MSKIDTKKKAEQLLRDSFETQHRSFDLDVRAVVQDDNTIKLSASSNKPDLRFIDTGEEFLFANEIISHKPKHLNLNRIKDGMAPFLFNHDVDQILGSIESARTQNQERLLATVRFSNEDDAQKRKRQVEEGVLRGVSIGYRATEYREVLPNPIKNGFRTFEATNTEIFEISLVATPADASVGIGRDLADIMTRSIEVPKDIAEKIIALLELKEVHESDAANHPSTIKPKDEHDDDDDDEERTETSPLLQDDAGEEPRATYEVDIRIVTPEYDIEVRNGEEEEIKHEIVLENKSDEIVIDEEVTKTDTTKHGDNTMSEKESVQVTVDTAKNDEKARNAEIVKLSAEYKAPAEKVNEWLMSDRSVDSIAREILEMESKNEVIDTRGAGHIELGHADAHRQFSFVRATNQLLKSGKLSGFEAEMNQEIAKRLKRSIDSPLGFYVPTSMGARPLDGRQLVMDAPGDGPELVFEKPGEFIELLRNKTKVIQLGARVMSGLSEKVTMPRRTTANSTSWIDEADSSGVDQTTGSFDQVLLAPKQLLSRTAASKQLLAVANYDVEALIRDDFARSFAVALDRAAISGSTNGPDPEGILNATGVQSNDTPVSGTIPTFDQMIALETLVAEANADEGALAYLTTPGVYGQLQATESFANTAATIINQITKEVNGFRIERSANVPNDLPIPEDSLDIGNAVIFGDWNQMIIGEWGALEVIVDPFSLKHRGLVEYNAIMLADIALRHPESFAMNLTARTTAQ